MVNYNKIKIDSEYSFLYGKLLSSMVYPEFFVIKKNDLVINIGCGNGPQAIIYEGAYAKMIGIDINQDRIDQSIKIMEKFGVENYEPIFANVEDLPIEKEFFDKALAIDIIEHVQDPNKMCKEIHRVLKNKRELLITFPAMHDKYVDFVSWVGRVIFRKKKKIESAEWHPDAHNHDYSLKKWIQLVESNGFILKKSRATTMFPPLHLYGVPRFWYSNNLIHRIDSIICTLPLIKNCGQTLLCRFEKK